MAIIPDVPHISVDIIVDGLRLPEFLDEDDEDSVTSDSTTKYVECVSGSKFALQINITGMELWDLQGGNAVCVRYYLDGERVDGFVIPFPLAKDPTIALSRGIQYAEGGSWKERDFMFADLVTTEDDVSGKPRPELKDLGTIKIELYYAQVGVASRTNRDCKGVILGHENIHEKHLKGQAISHQVKLGEAVPITNLTPVNVQHLSRAFATFNFRYRSRRDLQTLCLIPRSPSPVPLEDRPEESLSREELLELLRRQKAREEEQIKIKKEFKREQVDVDESDDDLIVISSRRPTKTFKTLVNADTGIETVDLTDD